MADEKEGVTETTLDCFPYRCRTCGQRPRITTTSSHNPDMRWAAFCLTAGCAVAHAISHDAVVRRWNRLNAPAPVESGTTAQRDEFDEFCDEAISNYYKSISQPSSFPVESGADELNAVHAAGYTTGQQHERERQESSGSSAPPESEATTVWMPAFHADGLWCEDRSCPGRSHSGKPSGSVATPQPPASTTCPHCTQAANVLPGGVVQCFTPGCPNRLDGGESSSSDLLKEADEIAGGNYGAFSRFAKAIAAALRESQAEVANLVEIQDRIDTLRAKAQVQLSEVRAQLEAAERLAEALNADTETCPPGCSTLGHVEECKTGSPAAIIEQQQASLRAALASVSRLQEEKKALVEGKVWPDADYWWCIGPTPPTALGPFPTADEALQAYHASRSTTEKNDDN